MANLDARYADGDSLWSLQQHGNVSKALSTYLMMQGGGGERCEMFTKNAVQEHAVDQPWGAWFCEFRETFAKNAFNKALFNKPLASQVGDHTILPGGGGIKPQTPHIYIGAGHVYFKNLYHSESFRSVAFFKIFWTPKNGCPPPLLLFTGCWRKKRFLGSHKGLCGRAKNAFMVKKCRFFNVDILPHMPDEFSYGWCKTIMKIGFALIETSKDEHIEGFALGVRHAVCFTNKNRIFSFGKNWNRQTNKNNS